MCVDALYLDYLLEVISPIKEVHVYATFALHSNNMTKYFPVYARVFRINKVDSLDMLLCRNGEST